MKTTKHNPVAKYNFNKPCTHKDKKKEARKVQCRGKENQMFISHDNQER